MEDVSSVLSRVAEALEIDTDLLRALGLTVESRNLSAGEALVERGDPVGDVFVILDGTLEVHGFDDQMLAALEPGAVVGEVAVLAGGTRTATVRSVGASEVAVVSADDFERIMAESPELFHRVSIEAIRRLDHRWLMEFITWLLGPVDPAIGDAISQAVVWHRIKAGDDVFHRGEPAEGGFAVIRGRIRVDTSDRAGDGHSFEVGRGALIGEEGLVAEGSRTESALALRDSVVVEVPRPAFLALIEAFPKVVASVLANLMRQRSQTRRSEARTATVILAVDTVRGTRLGRELAKELSDARFVTAGDADQLLDKPGVSQSPEGTPGDARLNQVLHELERESAHVIYLTDTTRTPWSERVIRQADNLVIAVNATAGDEELSALDDLVVQGSLGRLLLAVFHEPGTERPTSTAGMTRRWSPDMVIHVDRSTRRGLDRVARILADRAHGLVLGGGGARGFAHLGVWRALRELGVEIDVIGGASMGAAMGALIARGTELEQLEEDVKREFSGLLDYTLPLVSLIKGKRIARGLRRSMGDWDIEDLWIPFFCTSTNLTHSKVVVHDRGDLARAVRASISIPGVLPPIDSGTDLLVDSGLLNNLPADVMRRRVPHGTVIAVDVAPPIGPGSHTDLGMSVSAGQVIRAKFRRDGSRYPRMIPVMLRSMITASMRERDRALDNGLVDLHLDLDMRGVSLLDFEQADSVISAGYEAAAPRIEAWLEEQQA